MARAELVINLVETGIKGDLPRFRKTAEAIIADATARHQHILAGKLNTILTTTPARQEQQFTQSPELQNAFYQTLPQKTLSDLVLPDAVSAQFEEIVEEHKRRELLRSYNLQPRHRLLLCGAPGNGKTTFAEALANHLSLPFFTVKYEGLIHSYLGKTAQHLDQMFDYIKTQRCVLFFDEFDAIGKERDDVSDNGEMKRVVNSLIKQIDLLPSHVVLIGATNHESMLDRAIWRRFQLQLHIPSPTQKMAEKWFKIFEQRIGRRLGLSPSVLAKQLVGLSFAELEEFALDVQRKYVLGLPDSEKNMIDITHYCIALWKKRFKQEGS